MSNANQRLVRAHLVPQVTQGATLWEVIAAYDAIGRAIHLQNTDWSSPEREKLPERFAGRGENLARVWDRHFGVAWNGYDADEGDLRVNPDILEEIADNPYQ